MPNGVTTDPARESLSLDGVVTSRQGRVVLIAAEGSGGHLVPALETAIELASDGAAVQLLYAVRPNAAGLVKALAVQAREHGVTMEPVSLSQAFAAPRMFGQAGRRAAAAITRMWQAANVWRAARRRMAKGRPDVVAGFGGGFCVPVVFEAKWRGVPVLIHEQNVRLGRANRLAARWADCLARSFDPSIEEPLDRLTQIVTGLPVRRAIGTAGRDEAAAHFGFDPQRLTVLVVGGSQGAQAINRLVVDGLDELTPTERAAWQFVHIAGPQDAEAVSTGYRRRGVRAWVGAHVTQMALAYAVADLAVARAGASTVAELAQCGVPALLVPYPYAHGHQRDNARLVESVGGAICMDEASATSARLMGWIRRILSDARLCQAMAAQIATLARPDATRRLAEAIQQIARTSPIHSSHQRDFRMSSWHAKDGAHIAP